MAYMIGKQEVMEILGIQESKAYELIALANQELRDKGCYTIAGKTPRRFFLHKMGLDWLIDAEQEEKEVKKHNAAVR